MQAGVSPGVCHFLSRLTGSLNMVLYRKVLHFNWTGLQVIHLFKKYRLKRKTMNIEYILKAIINWVNASKVQSPYIICY